MAMVPDTARSGTFQAWTARVRAEPIDAASADGAQPIGGPITITVRKFGSGLGDEFRDLAPTVLNATNGSAGAGATFILDEALGTERVLRPGDVSGPVVMRLRMKDPLLVPNMHLLVRGGVPPAP